MTGWLLCAGSLVVGFAFGWFVYRIRREELLDARRPPLKEVDGG